MCSMLVPSEYSHLQKRSAKKLHFCTFPGNCNISESAKKLQKLFGSALSHLIICCFSWSWSGWLLRRPPRRWSGLLVVHICWCTLGALLVNVKFLKVNLNNCFWRFWFPECVLGLCGGQKVPQSPKPRKIQSNEKVTLGVDPKATKK